MWSVQAFRGGRLVPEPFRPTHLTLAAGLLLLYWVGRLGLTYGVGIPAFPNT